MRKLEIIVCGDPGVGKTHVSRMLRAFLMAIGFQVKLIDKDEPQTFRTGESAALMTIAASTAITIRTKMNRKPAKRRT